MKDGGLTEDWKEHPSICEDTIDNCIDFCYSNKYRKMLYSDVNKMTINEDK